VRAGSILERPLSDKDGCPTPRNRVPQAEEVCGDGMGAGRRMDIAPLPRISTTRWGWNASSVWVGNCYSPLYPLSN